MKLNLFLEIILILFAILASNGIIYNLKKLNFNIKNSNYSENISLRTNNSKKDGLTLTSLIASSPISLTSSESSTSQTLSVTSSDTLVSETLSVTSSDTNVSEDIFENWINSEIEYSERTMNHTDNAYLSSINNGNIPSNVDALDNFTSLDSLTILNSQTYEEWREIAMAFHELPINTPAGILQTFKVDELNILYSQDIIQYAITQAELRLIIEHLPAMSLFKPEINHLILTIMSYYHL